MFHQVIQRVAAAWPPARHLTDKLRDQPNCAAPGQCRWTSGKVMHAAQGEAGACRHQLQPCLSWIASSWTFTASWKFRVHEGPWSFISALKSTTRHKATRWSTGAPAPQVVDAREEENTRSPDNKKHRHPRYHRPPHFTDIQCRWWSGGSIVQRQTNTSGAMRRSGDGDVCA